MMLIIAAGVSAHSVPGLVDADARVTLKFYGTGVWVLFLGFNDSANGKRGFPRRRESGVQYQYTIMNTARGAIQITGHL